MVLHAPVGAVAQAAGLADHQVGGFEAAFEVFDRQLGLGLRNGLALQRGERGLGRRALIQSASRGDQFFWRACFSSS